MKIVNNKDMNKCILILTLCILSAGAVSASDYYYSVNSNNTDFYTRINDNTYQSMNTGNTYQTNNSYINGSDGSYYKKDGNMIYNMQTGSTYYNNNGYIQEF